MKKILAVVLRFLLYLILLLGTGFAIVFLYQSAAYEHTSGMAGSALAVSVSDTLLLAPGAGIAAILLCLFSTLRFDRFRVPSRIALFVLGAGFFFGIFSLWQFFPNTDSTSQNRRFMVRQDTVYQAPGLSLYIEHLNKNVATGVWIRTDGSGNSVKRVQTAIVDHQKGILLIPETGNQVDLNALNIGASTFLVSDMGGVGSWMPLERLRNGLMVIFKEASSHLMLRAAWSVVFSLTSISLWFWVRLSRWPLWNAVMVILVLAGTVYGAGKLLEPDTRILLTGINGFLADYAVPIALGIESVIWIVLVALLPPFKDWKREVSA